MLTKERLIGKGILSYSCDLKTKDLVWEVVHVNTHQTEDDEDELNNVCVSYRDHLTKHGVKDGSCWGADNGCAQGDVHNNTEAGPCQ